MADIIITECLAMRSESVTGPYDINGFHPDHTLLSCYSEDISIQVEILWTHISSKERFGPIQLVRCPPKMFRHAIVPILAPHFHVRISRSGEGNIPNNSLYVSIMNTKKKRTKKIRFETPKSPTRRSLPIPIVPIVPPLPLSGLSLDLEMVEVKPDKPEPVGLTSVTVIEEEKTSKELSRPSSPFRRSSKPSIFSREKKKTISTTGPPLVVHDARLPAYIPQGALLAGNKNGRMELIPKPYCAGLTLVSDEYGGCEWGFIYNFEKHKV